MSDREPFAEVARYLSVHRDHVDTVFRTLSYVDGVNFARRARADALFSVALMDPVCPPSTVFAAYHHYGSRSGARPATEIVEYAFNEHEGGAAAHWPRQVEWLAAQLAAPAGERVA